eukprot:scaffold539_cov359-Prasinococcus_capsulatus_cf.AAC.22
MGVVIGLRAVSRPTLLLWGRARQPAPLRRSVGRPVNEKKRPKNMGPSARWAGAAGGVTPARPSPTAAAVSASPLGGKA